MSGRDLFEGMSYVDERFVDEAENKTIPKRTVSPWIKVASMAACLCLIIFSLYNLQPYLNRGETEGAGQEAADAVPEGGVENKLKEESEQSISSPDEAPSSRAPEMMVCIQELTETGFIGTVENMSGFIVFEENTEITVTIDVETDPDFRPEAYNIGDLVHVMYTSWDEDERTIFASILGVVSEPICD